jgi:trypsin
MKTLHKILLVASASLAIAFSLTLPAKADGSLPSKDRSRMAPRIVGGTVAADRAYPWIVALVDNTGDQFCGGTLISKNKVLTAAHCSFSGDSHTPDPVSTVRVRVGTNQRGSGGQVFRVASQAIHPKYNHTTLDYDVAIWTLKTSTSNPLTLSDNVNIVKLPEACDDLACLTGGAYPGTTVLTAGWGATADGADDSSDELLEISIPVVSNAECRTAYSPEEITDRMLCAGVVGKDSCQGDSGGPLFAYLAEARTGLQTGIISWGDACAAGYGIYTRISHPEIRAFIRKKANI